MPSTSVVAVIVTSPAVTPFTVPSSTSAISSLEDVQIISALAPAGSNVALRLIDSNRSTLLSPLIEIPVGFGAATTVTSYVSVLVCVFDYVHFYG